MISDKKLAIIIPCYNVEEHIESVISSLPQYVDFIILVNDNSQDSTEEILKEIAIKENRIIHLRHNVNMGVGGSMITGFKKAVELNCDLIIKMDGDGQMDPQYIGVLAEPLIKNGYHFSKGNRFTDFQALTKMPFNRRIGNLILSFLIKAASGYWEVFDPTNGYFCIQKDVLKKLNYNHIDKRYFFESSLIIELFYAGARIYDVPIPAKYGIEKSNLSVINSIFSFPIKIFKALCRRVLLRYFLYDFNIFSIYILIGIPLFVFGLVFGIINWISYASADIPAPVGTVMLATLPIVLGFQLLLSAIHYDVTSKNPFEKGQN